MKKILILFAHPAMEKSRIHTVLLQHIKNIDGVTLNDLYENYPDFDIDVEREQQLLLSHDIIVWQHPFYWYSAPALLKQWQDLVLEHGWAYGKNGVALKGKTVFNAFTSGGSMQSYQAEGFQRCTIQELLRPFERTAQLCNMNYLPPFWVAGTHRLEQDQIRQYGVEYRQLLTELRNGDLKKEVMEPVSCLNDLLRANNIIQS